MAVDWFNAYFGMGQNPNVASNTTNHFEVAEPDDHLAGNALCLFLAWNDIVVTISTINDPVNGSWNLAAAPTGTLQKSLVGGSNSYAFLVFAGAGAGFTNATIKFSGAVQPPVVRIFSVPGVNTSQASISGGASAGVTGQAGPNLTCGSFTPTDNHLNGGNIIFAFVNNASNFQSAQAPSSFVALNSFKLMCADIDQHNNATPDGNPKAMAYIIQSGTSTAINPAMTATGDTDSFDNFACALQLSPGAGTQPSGLYTVSVTTHAIDLEVATWTVQQPCYGNSRIWANDAGAGFTKITDTDNGGSGYPFITGDVSVAGTGASPEIFKADTQTQDLNNFVVATAVAGSVAAIKGQCKFLDMAGCAPGVGANVAIAGPTANNNTQTNVPSITPTVIGSKILNIGVVGNGPQPPPIITPSNARFLGVKYWNEGDGDAENIGDFQAIATTTSLATQNWSYRCGMVFIYASASWALNAGTISLQGAISGIPAGAAVFDHTSGQSIGTCAAIAGSSSTLTMQGAGATHASSGSADILYVESIVGGSGVSVHAVELLPLSVVDTLSPNRNVIFQSQWKPNATLLRNTAQDFSSFAPETNTHFISRAWPLQWNIDRRLYQTRMSGPEFSLGVETNQHYKPQAFPPLWFLTQWQRTNDATFVAAIDTPTYVIPRSFPPQWNRQPSLMRGAAQDFSSSSPETNIHYIPITWPFQWKVQQSLMRGTAQDFSSTPVVVTGFHILTPMGARLITPIGI